MFLRISRTRVLLDSLQVLRKERLKIAFIVLKKFPAKVLFALKNSMELSNPNLVILALRLLNPREFSSAKTLGRISLEPNSETMAFLLSLNRKTSVLLYSNLFNN